MSWTVSVVATFRRPAAAAGNDCNPQTHSTLSARYIRRFEVLRSSICLSVCSLCLSACVSQKRHVQISPNFLYVLPVAVARSSSEALTTMWLWHVMYFRFRGWRHVFAYWREWRDRITTRMFCRVRQVAAPVGCQTTLFGRILQTVALETKSAVSNCILLFAEFILLWTHLKRPMSSKLPNNLEAAMMTSFSLIQNSEIEMSGAPPYATKRVQLTCRIVRHFAVVRGARLIWFDQVDTFQHH